MSSYSNQEWIIDTGANDHVISNFSCLNSPISCASNTSLAKNCQNGDSAPVTHIRLALVSENIQLHNVLCVPISNSISYQSRNSSKNPLILTYVYFKSSEMERWCGLVKKSMDYTYLVSQIKVSAVAPQINSSVASHLNISICNTNSYRIKPWVFNLMNLPYCGIKIRPCIVFKFKVDTLFRNSRFLS